MSPAPEIRDAATVILLRRTAGTAEVLMGQRGTGAAFMPDLFVFPGGAVDAEDRNLAPDTALDPETGRRLAIDAPEGSGPALALAAVRELWEETGLMLGRPDPGAAARTVPDTWLGFFAEGLLPATDALTFVFRAITPPGRPRRFDARFFIAEAAAIAGCDDDFGQAGDELRHLQWIGLPAARALPLPFITSVVLAEIGARLAAPDVAHGVPFFHQRPEGMRFSML